MHDQMLFWNIIRQNISQSIPDSKAHGANMGPTWGRQDPGAPHDGPMGFAILVHFWWSRG